MQPRNRRRHWAMGLLAVCCLMSQRSFLKAEETGSEKHTIVVLTDGRLFQGRVTRVPGGYRVDNARGYVILPFTHVRTTAATLEDAYQAMRGAITRPNANAHLQLAEWCLQHKMYESARSEVAQALALEPLRADARTLLSRIDTAIAPPEAPLPEPESQAPFSANVFASAQDTNATGLSRETTREFIRRVQPLLLNTCGNAACHGQSSHNEFRLSNVHGGSSAYRRLSNENQAAILKYLSRNDTANSPLLKKPLEDTAAHRDVFLGPQRHLQFSILRDWVETASNDLSHLPPTAHQNSVVTASATDENFAAETPIAARGTVVTADAEAPSPAQIAERSLLDRIRAQQRPDAFDPDLFNRRVHGQSAAELKAGR